MTGVLRFLFVFLLLFSDALAWKMESGTVTLPNLYDESSPHFTHVNFRQVYDVPPLVFAVATTRGSDPCSLRIKNVTTTGFDISQVEPPPEDGPHIDMTIHYFAIEPGVHQLPNGIRFVAGTVTTDVVQHGSNVPGPEGWETVSFPFSFASTPVVLAFIQTMNSEEKNPPRTYSAPWLTVAVDDVTENSFKVALERSEVAEGTVNRETIGYFAVGSGIQSSFYDNSGNLISFETIRTGDLFKGWGTCRRQSFNLSYSSPPNVIGTKNTRNGGDGGWFRRCYLSKSQVGFVVDEDRYFDSERRHTAEAGGIVVFSGDFDASFYTVSGRVYEDIDGDGDISDDGVALEGVRVSLYRDNGDGSPGSGDVLVATTTTDSTGTYSFVVENGFTYFVVVDSRTVSPSSGFNSGYGQEDVWAEQTYGGKGVYRDDDGDPGTPSRPVGTPGPAYGGAYPDRSDDASSISTAKHIAKVEVNGSDVSGVDFGFSFNVVTNVNDRDDDSGNRTCQGCLRQFIQNANAISGPNRMRFVPAVLENENGWWQVLYRLGPMPELVDSDTVIDGTAYCAWKGGVNGCSSTSQVRDENAGTEGSGGTVGVGPDGVAGTGDEPSLPAFQKPELEINGGGEDYAIEIGNGSENPSGVVVKRLAIYNVSRDAIRVEGGANGFQISENFIGFRADGSVPPPEERVGWQGIKVVDDTLPQEGGSITGNYIGYCGRYNISVGNSSTTGDDSLKTVIRNNEIVGAGCGSSYRYADNISVYADDVRIEENLIRDACMGGGSSPKSAGKGIEVRYRSKNTVIRNNTIVNNASAGIYFDQASNDGTVEFNLIHDNGHTVVSAGVAVSNNSGAAYRVKISKNSIYSNGGLSVDLDGDGGAGNGVTANDGEFTTGKPNYYIDYPVFTRAEISADVLHVEGYVGTSTSHLAGTFTVELFKADDDGDNSGEVEEGDGRSVPHGEGKEYLGSCVTSSDGTFSCDITLSRPVLSQGDFITGTAYLDGKGTSEMAANFQVTVSRASVSGYVFNDRNHDSLRESDEGGLGVQVFVKACQNGEVVAVSTPEPSSGYYEFIGLPPGTYTMVETTDSSTASCSPSDPDGFISTTPDVVRVEVSQSRTARVNFGDFHGAKVSGFVFNDMGDGSSTSTAANNVLFDPGEEGIAGVTLRLCTDPQCSTVVEETKTSSDGSYSLWAPADYDGQTLYIVEEDLNGYTSTGDSRNNTVDSGPSAPVRERNTLSWTVDAGSEFSGYNFGDVRKLTLSPPQSFVISAGSSFTFSHSFHLGTPGTVSIRLTSKEGWSYVVYEDLDCDGVADSSEPSEGPSFNGGAPLSAGKHCFIVKAHVPSGVSPGSTDALTLTVEEDWLNTSAGADDVASVVDSITAGGETSGVLRLEKWVRNVSAGEDFRKVNTAKPCQVLEYRIDFKNLGTRPVKSVVIGDLIPRGTGFLTGQYNSGSGDVEVKVNGETFYGTVSESPDVDGVVLEGGSLKVELDRLTGGKYRELRPGQEGYLLYRVRLEGSCH